MLCCSVPIRGIENLFVENKVCDECFKLKEIVIGYKTHYIVHDENIARIAYLSQIGDFIYTFNLTFDQLDLIEELGCLIVMGDNYITCEGMTKLENT